MKFKNQILRILILSISIITLYNIKSYCDVSGTKRMEITGGDPWTNINVSKAYNECESLNSTTSTLGTNNLRAHLTTDADWSAMAIFSIRQYGAATTNTPESTTGNVSGVYSPGRKMTYSTGILNTATKTSYYSTGLFNNDGTLKPYMKPWSSTRTDNDFVGFKGKNEGGTYGWFGSIQAWGTNTSYKISVKTGLFGVALGSGNGGAFNNSTAGYGDANTTFRPVIWN